MSQINADRNLLLGILAYQNAFVTRDALFAGMQAWLYDKTKSLADILQNQGALDAERRQLLEAMVQHHLKQHGDDPQRSLHAVSSASSVRGDLEKMPDPELQASLAHLSKAKDDDDPFRTRSMAGTPTSAGTRFRRLRPHAKGGLGEVFVALDSELNREVALKEIQDRHADEPESRTRFLQEAEITGGLEHPGIVPVYGLGTYADGRPFYAMRFIRGDSLMEAIAKYHKPHPQSPKPRGEYSNPAGSDAGSDKHLQLHKLVRRLIDVCNALQYAHDRGVLHRDLKPGNIMLGKYGETLVVDWGLAKASGEAGEPRASATGAFETPLRPASGSGSAETMPGSAIGTPAFMSPEQAAGRLDLLGPASDIYSLGATLYCLLTGRPPLKGSVAEVLKKAQDGDFPCPRQVDAAIARALEAVCLKAMALRPDERYATPQQLAEDLEHWLADEPVQAWPEPWTVKTRRWTGRHRVLASSAAACLVVALAGSIAGTVLLSEANETIRNREGETKKANQTLVEANEEIRKRDAETKKAYQDLAAANKDEKKARDLAEDRLATSTMMLARSRFEEGQAWLADELLAQVPPKFRFASWGLLKNYIRGSQFTLRGHTSGVASVAFSVDGRLLASASGDTTVKLWDARTGQELRTLHGHKNTVTSVAFAADGQILASASYDKTVKLWEARTGKELHILRGHSEGVTSIAFGPDSQVLASASSDRTIKLWNVRTGQELRTLLGHSHIVTSIAFSTDGQVLASGSITQVKNFGAGDMGTAEVKLWDVPTGRERRTLLQYSFGEVRTRVAFSADGQLLASANYYGRVILWDARTGLKLHTLHGIAHELECLAFSADGQVLALASGNDVKLCDAPTGKELRILRGHTSGVASVAFSADGQVLASTSYDNTVKLWDARTTQELRTLDVLAGSNDPGMTFWPGGTILAARGLENTVKILDAWTFQERRTLRGHTKTVTWVSFTADSEVLATASHDKTVKLWDARAGQELHTLRGHGNAVTSVAFSADGQTVVSASLDNTIKLWDAQTGQELRTLHGHTNAVTSVAFVVDDQVLASASDDNTVKLWDVRTGKDLHTLCGHAGLAQGWKFASHGHILALAAPMADRDVELWDTRTRKQLRTLRGHTGEVTSLAFAAEGRVLATASWDKTVKLWDVSSGQELRTMRGHTTAVSSLAFAADGQLLASATDGQTVKLWDVRTDQEPEKERRFHLWVTAPDPHLHRKLAEENEKQPRDLKLPPLPPAEQPEREKQPFALAFRLGRYFAAKNYYAAEPKEAATLAGWLGTAAQPPGLLPGMPALVKTPFHEPIFPDGIACTGVLYKDSGIAPERLLVGTSRALAGDPSNWLNHAFHGGALFRKGEHAKALAALTEATRLHGEPSPLTHNLLGLTHLAMGEKDRAKDGFSKAQPAKDAPWEDGVLHRLFQPEIDAALARADGKQ